MESILANLEGMLRHGSVLAFLAVYLGGVATSFTPCIYPMIPITISVIGGQKQRTRFHAFILSVWYVLGLAVTYTVLGIAAVATGSLFGTLSANTWVLFGIANVCILFGLSMFDVFMIDIPWLNRLQSGRPRGGSAAGVFVLGVLFGLVASPCTAPVLGVILAFASQSKSLFFGGSLLFVYAIGIGTLLVVIGTFSGVLQLLPKSGVWMNMVKKAFGFIMIAMGEYYLIQMGRGLF
jgi:thiol:disulfide interchange protein DsbD